VFVLRWACGAVIGGVVEGMWPPYPGGHKEEENPYLRGHMGGEILPTWGFRGSAPQKKKLAVFVSMFYLFFGTWFSLMVF
jgi:hypothetical protein